MTGASGLLGNKIAELAFIRGHHVYSSYKEHVPAHGNPILLDQTEEAQVWKHVSKIQPHAIINAAGLTDVDLCEERPETAFLVNATSVGHLAEAAKEYGAFLVQVSTDYVFDGEKGGYSESDNPHPINRYGLSKLKGEEAAMSFGGEQWCIGRASVVYGWGRLHRPNAATYIYSKLSKREKVSIVGEQYSSPTLNTNLARMLVEIMERMISGILHTAGASRLSRYEFAMELARALGLDVHLISSEPGQPVSWKAKRPRDSSLDVARASKILSNPPLSIQQAISQLVQEHTSLQPPQRE